MEDQPVNDFDVVRTRLDEIVEAVSDESISLDDALALYDEAVELGMKASSLLEVGISQADAAEASSSDATAQVASSEANQSSEPASATQETPEVPSTDSATE